MAGELGPDLDVLVNMAGGNTDFTKPGGHDPGHDPGQDPGLAQPQAPRRVSPDMPGMS